jgi:sulfur carrier protein
MNVLVNNKPEELAEAATLLQLLTQVKLSDRPGIAVAVNNSIISQNNWNNFKLNENDKITVIRATQGG